MREALLTISRKSSAHTVKGLRELEQNQDTQWGSTDDHNTGKLRSVVEGSYGFGKGNRMEEGGRRDNNIFNKITYSDIILI